MENPGVPSGVFLLTKTWAQLGRSGLSHGSVNRNGRVARLSNPFKLLTRAECSFPWTRFPRFAALKINLYISNS
jgi:hypothetical protein